MITSELPLRVLFVWPSAEMSVWDVARGYRGALARLIGEDRIRDYHLNKHAVYHANALPPDQAKNMTVLSRMATESILAQATYASVDSYESTTPAYRVMVLIIAGLNFHPVGLWLLKRYGFETAVILTESPYEDENQLEWVSTNPDMTVFTTERTSSKQYGWHYLRHAYDPAVHFPVKPTPDGPEPCDVLMIGTGWLDRQRFLEQVDWTGINLRLMGAWMELRDHPESPLFKFYQEGFVDNLTINQQYASAKICLNFHRGHATAESANPRVYEIAACGALQVCDDREEVAEIFGSSVPGFRAPKELEIIIRHLLGDDDRRRVLVQRALQHVSGHTFDARVEEMWGVITGSRPAAEPLPVVAV